MKRTNGKNKRKDTIIPLVGGKTLIFSVDDFSMWTFSIDKGSDCDSTGVAASDHERSLQKKN